MKTPPMLTGAALLFWGWQTGLLIPAVIIAALFEGAGFVTWRLNLAQKDFYRIWNLCALMFFGAGVVMYTSNKGAGAIFTIVQWFPIIFLPIAAAQVYSLAERIELGVFSIFYRTSDSLRGEPPASINITYPYFAICIAAASAANNRTIGFYIGLCVLSAWALWPVRSKSGSPAVWAGTLAIAALLGFAGSVGLQRLHNVVDEKMLNLYAAYFQQDKDPFRTYTAIGEIGALKMSNRILFRVKNETGYHGEILLPRSSYNTFRAASWFASRSPFSPAQGERDGLSWRLMEGDEPDRAIRVSTRLKYGAGLLMAPNGSYRIERMPALKMSRNRMGAVKVEDGPGFVSYIIRIADGVSLNGPPDKLDTAIPDDIDPAVRRIARELKLDSKTPEEILRVVRSFFEENFSYSLDLESGKFGETPLVDFLERTRAGHCEYFASATVMLLRKAGIPARYAVGYSANEFSWLEKQFVVRLRDAHAWVLAYVNGEWRNFDTTPPSWKELDKKNSAFWDPIMDIWSYAAMLFSKWRWSEGGKGYQRYLVFALIPLALFLAWRLLSRPLVAVGEERIEENAVPVIRQGADSGFYLIEKRLEGRGFERRRGETVRRWAERVKSENGGLGPVDDLPPIVELHYRYRFDPAGLTDTEKDELNGRIQSWLRR